MNLESFVPWILEYWTLFSFLGGFFFGIETIILFSFIGTAGNLNLFVLLFFGFIGLVLSDCLSFWIGKSKILSKLTNYKKLKENKKKIKRIFGRLTSKNLFFTLLYTKIIYGVSIAILIYLGTKKIKWKDFLINNALVNLLLATIAVLIGWFGGYWFKFIIYAFKSIQIGIIFIVLFIIVIILIQKLLNYILLTLMYRKKEK